MTNLIRARRLLQAGIREAQSSSGGGGGGGTTVENSGSWVRNPSWPVLPTITDADNTFVGILAVFPDYNPCAFNFAGNYHVVWGDGSSEDVASGVQAEHLYDFNDADLAGTDAPVTLTASGSTVGRTAHGYINDMPVQLYNIVTTAGITEAANYYVINKTADTFQLSLTKGGSAVTMTGNGTATLLPYKCAVVVVTMQSGQTFTSINLQCRHSAVTSGILYESGWLDFSWSGASVTTALLAVSVPSTTTFIVALGLLEQVRIYNNKCRNAARWFLGCGKLSSIPVLNVDVTPAYVLSATFTDAGDVVTAVAHGLTLNTPLVVQTITTTTGMVKGDLVYAINVATDTFQVSTSVGGSAIALTTNGSGSFAVGTNCQAMFSVASSATPPKAPIPLFDTSAVVFFGNIFANNGNISSLPVLNTSAGRVFTNFFNTSSTADSVLKLPIFDTSAGLLGANMFAANSLIEVPAFNLSSFTTLGAIATSGSLRRFKATGMAVSFSVASNLLGKTALEEIFSNLGNGGFAATITITGNPGSDTPVVRSCTATAKSTILLAADTSSVVAGMTVTGSTIAGGGGVDYAADVTADTLTLTAHGHVNGTSVSPKGLSTITGLTLGTTYYIVNATANTFQLSATLGGVAIDLTGTNGTVGLAWQPKVASIITNTSITLNSPASSSATSNLSFRNLDFSAAITKGWAVTF